MAEVLLLGAGGALASAFRAMLPPPDVGVLSGEALRQVDPGRMMQEIRNAKPEVVINCAAHTDVEGAEANPEIDRLANSELPGVIARVCAAAGVPMIHFSSTGCYGDWKEEPYTERDSPQPTTVHHRNKIAGEEAVRSSGCDSLIIRTGWLFGGPPAGAKNFVWKRLVEALLSREMVSDHEQRGCPTFVEDLVVQVMVMAKARQRGLFNVVAQGSASRFEYVQALVRFAGLACEVRPGAAFARRAPVSRNEMAVNERLQICGIDSMPSWRDPLQSYVRRLTSTREWIALAAGQRETC